MDTADEHAPTYEHPLSASRTVALRDAPTTNQPSSHVAKGNEITRDMLIDDAHLDYMAHVLDKCARFNKHGVHCDGPDLGWVSEMLAQDRNAELAAEYTERQRVKESSDVDEATYGRPPNWLGD